MNNAFSYLCFYFYLKSWVLISPLCFILILNLYASMLWCSIFPMSLCDTAANLGSVWLCAHGSRALNMLFNPPLVWKHTVISFLCFERGCSLHNGKWFAWIVPDIMRFAVMSAFSIIPQRNLAHFDTALHLGLKKATILRSLSSTKKNKKLAVDVLSAVLITKWNKIKKTHLFDHQNWSIRYDSHLKPFWVYTVYKTGRENLAEQIFYH